MFYEDTQNDSVSSNTNKIICSLSLPPDRYLIVANAYFSIDGSNTISCAITDGVSDYAKTSTSDTRGFSAANCSCFLEILSQTTISLEVNSAKSGSVSGRLQALTV